MLIYKSKEEIKLIEEGGKILNNILNKLCDLAKEGVSTAELEKVACDLIDQAGGRPSFKDYEVGAGYDPYPTALCTSINDEIVHAPSLPGRILKNGDIVGIDIGMEYPIKRNKNDKRPWNKHSKLGGYYTDMAKTVIVGEVSPKIKKLVEVTEKSLYLAIEQIKPGNTVEDIGRAVQKIAKDNGFAVVRDLVGHGVGVAVHEEPHIPNYVGKKRHLTPLKPGMVIAIEPMLTTGTWKIKTGSDNITFKTADGSMSAHFEHTVAVTDKGYKILTL